MMKTIVAKSFRSDLIDADQVKIGKITKLESSQRLFSSISDDECRLNLRQDILEKLLAEDEIGDAKQRRRKKNKQYQQKKRNVYIIVAAFSGKSCLVYI